jgi:pimeloyl-ACP methyl ester carboxylesterase
MPVTRPTLLLFPGLGVGADLFRPQRSISAKIIIRPWPIPMENESPAHYAHRMIDGFDPPPNLFLGGMSFGGMLALEAAKYLNPRGVFLIASARDGRAHASLFQLLGKILPGMPMARIEILLKLLAPSLVRIVGRPNRSQRELLLSLVRHAHLPLTRWGAGASMNYVFTGKLDCPIWHIHGDIDRVVPIENVRREVDTVVPNAGHIVNVTHAGIVNRFIEGRMERAMRTDHIGSSLTV